MRGFFIFLGMALLLRADGFQRSVLDPDESLYLLMAREWLQGHVPYTVIWDNKPPGIYALFAGALAVFGESVAAIRILACLAVAATATLLQGLVLRVGAGKLAGWCAGVGYLLLTLRNGGLAANTEIFFAPLVSAAFLVTLPRPGSPPVNLKKRALLAGLLAGVAFQIKYIALSEITILGGLWLLAGGTRRLGGSFRHRVAPAAIFLAGLLFPTAVVMGGFQIAGLFPEYWQANFTANRLRVGHTGVQPVILFVEICRQFLVSPFFWGAAVFFLFRNLRRPPPAPPEEIISRLGLVWLGASLLGILIFLRGVIFPHYFLQAAPALALLGGIAAEKTRVFLRSAGLAQGRKTAILTAAILAFAWPAVRPVAATVQDLVMRTLLGKPYWKDAPREMAEWLRPRMVAGDTLFVVDGEPVLYFLTRSDPPTRYAFPFFLGMRMDMTWLSGVDPLREVDRIFSKLPRYVIIKIPEARPDAPAQNQHRRIQMHLDDGYQKAVQIQEFEIYERNPRLVLPQTEKR